MRSIDKQHIEELYKTGLSGRTIAARLGLSKSSVNSYIQTLPKTILYLDIETAPSVAASFQRFNVNLSSSHILEQGGWLLSAAWAWNEGPVEGMVLRPNEARAKNDYRIIDTLYPLLEKAKVTVAHNGDRFDLPSIRTRMLLNNRVSPKKSKQIDTLKMAKQLKFNSNKLESLAIELGLSDVKQDVGGMSTWIDCIQGDKSALERMLSYNKQDVNVLRKVYHKLRSYSNQAVNVALFDNQDNLQCSVCSSIDLCQTDNLHYAGNSAYPELICMDCGSRHRSRVAAYKRNTNTLLVKQ